MRVLFVRHGDTEMNLEKKFRGWTDVPLAKQGIAQGQATHKKYGKSLDSIYASDLTRAVQTGQILAKGRIPSMILDTRLRPWDVGQFTGQPKDEATRQALMKYVNSPDTPIPGGESLNDFTNRYAAGLKDILEREHPDANVAVVSHASNIRAVNELLRPGQTPLLVKPGGVLEMNIGLNGQSLRILHGARPNADSEQGLS